jgi:uncharacterized membrane protein YpjA
MGYEHLDQVEDTHGARAFSRNLPGADFFFVFNLVIVWQKKSRPMLKPVKSWFFAALHATAEPQEP